MILLINHRLRMTVALMALSMGLLSTACSTQKHAIPEQGLTLPALYREALNHNDGGFGDQDEENQDIIKALKQDSESVQPSYVGYTRTANNEINNLFKPLPNPSVPIYIYPHLTQIGGDMIPVPGYTSNFFLYKQNRYATIAERY
jgi:conjugative transfer region lipoprotein (TIGR03751 family)